MNAKSGPGPAECKATTSRRAFLRAGALALISSPAAADLLARDASPARPSPLKSQAQYKGEAANFETGMSQLASIGALSLRSGADLSRVSQPLQAAAVNLDHHHSWMVEQCMADEKVMEWARRTLRDETAAKTFIANVQRNPKYVDTIPGVSALKARLARLSAEKRAIALQLSAKLREVAGLESASANQAAEAKAAQDCAKTWAIVGAIIAAVVAIVVAVVVTVFTFGAASLAETYKGTGPDVSNAALRRADQEYRECVQSANRLPARQRDKALAACLARLIETKAAYIA